MGLQKQYKMRENLGLKNISGDSTVYLKTGLITEIALKIS
jgi:hypothetical protein